MFEAVFGWALVLIALWVAFGLLFRDGMRKFVGVLLFVFVGACVVLSLLS